jgi:hypothetical protein
MKQLRNPLSPKPNTPTHAGGRSGQLLDALPFQDAGTDASGSIVFASEAITRLLGWSVSQLLGAPWQRCCLLRPVNSPACLLSATHQNPGAQIKGLGTSIDIGSYSTNTSKPNWPAVRSAPDWQERTARLLVAAHHRPESLEPAYAEALSSRRPVTTRAAFWPT